VEDIGAIPVGSPPTEEPNTNVAKGKICDF